MMGNWSFGDYYKREAITWAWELLTGVWKLPKERLYATVFGGDQERGLPADLEAERLWAEVTDIDPSHIQRFGAKDNFWMMGDVGPCGPCSEIHIDLTPDASGSALVNAGSPQVMELWNLVFIEFNAEADGGLKKLPACHVDTGAGLDRISAVMECTDGGRDFTRGVSNYDTALFRPILARLEELSGRTYTPGVSQDEDSIAMRVCADHLRMVAFSIADGAIPSNESRGYVVRRVLRRAARYGRKLGLMDPFLHHLVPVLAETMGDVFPELLREQTKIQQIMRGEETSFHQTLDRGIALFEEEAGRVEVGGVFPGEVAFKLYDTYGFPVEITRELAREHGLKVDEEAFQERFREHQKTSQTGAEQRFKGGLADTGEQTARLHTATHLLQSALRQVLGTEVHQKGSNITAERLRFDFTFGRRMTEEELQEVERLVNEAIRADVPVTWEEMTVDEAKAQGAMGLFDSKYGEKVRVYTMGGFSREICGGPHASRTGELGSFRIQKEESSSAGVRRIRAVIG